MPNVAQHASCRVPSTLEAKLAVAATHQHHKLGSCHCASSLGAVPRHVYVHLALSGRPPRAHSTCSERGAWQPAQFETAFVFRQCAGHTAVTVVSSLLMEDGLALQGAVQEQYPLATATCSARLSSAVRLDQAAHSGLTFPMLEPEHWPPKLGELVYGSEGLGSTAPFHVDSIL